MSVETSVEQLPNMHQPDQFDFCEGYSRIQLFNGNQWHAPLNLYTFNVIATTITKLHF